MFETAADSIQILCLPAKGENYTGVQVNQEVMKVQGFSLEEAVIDISEDLHIGQD
jgi:hypothetical protein